MSQPYADLLALGEKTIECRVWNTKFRGEFLIHASKKFMESVYESDFEEIQSRSPILIGNILGAIIGKAELIDVITYRSYSQFNQDRNKHYAIGYFEPEEFEKGRAHGFIVRNAVRFETPIPCAGMLNFWTVPESVVSRLVPLPPNH